MGRGKSLKNKELIHASAEILFEIQPATVRAVCYKLFTLGKIPNMSKASTNIVSRQLVWAREEGVIPWEWVVDETRRVERKSCWSDLSSYAMAVKRSYCRDRWEMQPYKVEVWSEKGTVRGTLAPVLDEYGAAFRVMHGYGSATALNSVAEESSWEDEPLEVLYVGDWDPSGMHMSEVDLPGRLDRYDGHISLSRIALTAGDVKGGGLPSFDARDKIGDRRYKWFVRNYGHSCWELDAMDPVSLRQRVEESIRELIDGDAWNRAELIEKAEFDSLSAFAEGLSKAREVPNEPR